MNGFQGYKETQKIEKTNFLQQEKYILISNKFQKKYNFILSIDQNNVNIKKEVMKILLTQFTEGIEKTTIIKKLYQRKQANEEILRSKLFEERRKLELEIKKTHQNFTKSKEPEVSLDTDKINTKKIENIDTLNNTLTDSNDNTSEIDIELKKEIIETNFNENIILEKTTANKTTEDFSKIITTKMPTFKNLLDESAFFYKSTRYEFSIKVPAGFWFRNFGKIEDSLGSVGFSSTGAVNTTKDVEFWLNIIKTNIPLYSIKISKQNNLLKIEFPKNQNEKFIFSGNIKFQDVILSIISSIDTNKIN